MKAWIFKAVVVVGFVSFIQPAFGSGGGSGGGSSSSGSSSSGSSGQGSGQPQQNGPGNEDSKKSLLKKDDGCPEGEKFDADAGECIPEKK